MPALGHDARSYSGSTVAQSWRVSDESRPKGRRPLDEEGLKALALAYAGRYATSRARLTAYLVRKLRERGWAGAGEPPVAALADRFVALGYVDDRQFAAMRAASLARRGYGARRVAGALRDAGIAEEDAAAARAAAEEGALAAALAFARRRRFGPYAARSADPDMRRRAFAAFLRAGHPPALVERVLAMAPGEAREEE